MRLSFLFSRPDGYSNIERIASKLLFQCLQFLHCLSSGRFFLYLLMGKLEHRGVVGQAKGPTPVLGLFLLFCLCWALAVRLEPWSALEMFPNLFTKMTLKVGRRGLPESTGDGLGGWGFVFFFLNWFQYYCGFIHMSVNSIFIQSV